MGENIQYYSLVSLGEVRWAAEREVVPLRTALAGVTFRRSAVRAISAADPDSAPTAAALLWRVVRGADPTVRALQIAEADAPTEGAEMRRLALPTERNVLEILEARILVAFMRSRTKLLWTG